MGKKLHFTLLAALLAALLLAGCGMSRKAKCAGIAEKYLAELQSIYGGDSFTLQKDTPEQYGELYSFAVQSQKYGDTFFVNVNGDDSTTDTYFSVMLKESAAVECAQAIESVQGSDSLQWEVGLTKHIVASALSGKTFASVREASAACRNIGLLEISLSSSKGELQEETLAAVLRSLLEQKMYGRLTVAGDVRVFDIGEDGITVTEQTTGSPEVLVYEYEL